MNKIKVFMEIRNQGKRDREAKNAEKMRKLKREREKVD